MITTLDEAESAGSLGSAQPLFPGLEFATPWHELSMVSLAPEQVFAPLPEDGTEVGYVLLDGSFDIVTGEGISAAKAPAALLCGVGLMHELDAEMIGARLVRLAVRCGEAGSRGIVAQDELLLDAMTWRSSIHGGGGRIATRHVWGPEDFASSWAFVDHAVLSKGSSLGHHYHEHMEEAFVVLSGLGWMTIGDDTHQVGPGSVTFQAAGEGHGLYNPFDDDLDFVRVAVASPDAAFTTIDLDDDLLTRRPATETTT